MGLLDYAIKFSLCLPDGREDEIIVCEEVESMIDLFEADESGDRVVFAI